MKRRLAAAICVVFLFSNVASALGGPAQQTSQTSGPWEWRNPLPQGNDIYDVDFAPDGLHGIAIGTKGMLMRTTGGGASWSLGSCPTLKDLLSLCVLDATHAWAVGTSGTIVYSSDGGATWSVQTSGTSAVLYGIDFATTAVGWACGASGTILKTSNGGASWVPQTSGTTAVLISISAVTTNHVWTSGAGGLIRRTLDGGANWSPQTSGTTKTLECIEFTDTLNGWACGEGSTMLHTTNGGSDWVPQDPDAATYLYEVEFTDALHGWTVGIFGLSRTDDGGATWSAVTRPSVSVLGSIAVVDSETVHVGQREPGDLWRTGNAGNTWVREQGGPTASLRDAAFGTRAAGWLVGDSGTVLTTADGGLTWTPQTSSTSGSLLSVCARDASTAWAAGGSSIIRTTNGGATWTPKTVSGYVTGIDFSSATEGWAVGHDGLVLKSTDGGATWDPSSTGVPADVDFTDVDFASDTNGIAVGTYGDVYYTTDGGAHWSAASAGVPAGHDFASVHMVSASEAWAVCNLGNADARILHTTDGGNSWETHPRAGTFNDIWTDVCFSDADNGWITGMIGRMLATRDGGLTWENVMTPVSRNLLAVAAPGAGRVVASGDFGIVVLRRTTVGRVSGADRYATAIAASAAHFPTADTVLIATGAAFPDALAASGLAGALEAPLLLVRPDLPLPAGLLTEIDRLGASQAIVIGGRNAVSDNVVSALRSAGLTVSRVEGADRYDTARSIAMEIQDALPGDVQMAFIARGDAFPDALAWSPVARSAKVPVLLVRPDSLPAPTEEAIADLGITRAIIGGGIMAVTGDTKAAIDARLVANGGIPSERWYGADRYETAAEIAGRSVPRWATRAFTGLATGTNFPDALGGGVAIGAEGGVLLLTSPTSLPASVQQYFTDFGHETGDLEIFGGTTAVGSSVQTQVESLLR